MNKQIPRKRSLDFRARRWLLFAVLLVAACGLLYRMLRPYFESQPPTQKEESVATTEHAVTVLRVIDGDTIEVRWRGRPERVRLLRIDTPERGRHGYDEATRALERLVGGREVVLEFERPGRVERDKYDRLLAYVIVEGENANVELVRQGWTRFWTRYGAGRLADELTAAEREAREHSAGLWSGGEWNAN